MKLDIKEGEKPLSYSFENCALRMPFEETFKQNVENMLAARRHFTLYTCKLTEPLSLSSIRYLKTFNAYLRFLHPGMFSKFNHIVNSVEVEETIVTNLEYYSKRYLKNKQKNTLQYIEDLCKLKLLYLEYKAVYLS